MRIESFWNKVNKNGPIPESCPELGRCWIWLGALTDSGYGRVNVNGKRRRAHRIAYLLSGKEIPFGYHLHHRCVTRSCVNDNHLVPVTPKTHPDAGFNASRKTKNIIAV